MAPSESLNYFSALLSFLRHSTCATWTCLLAYRWPVLGKNYSPRPWDHLFPSPHPTPCTKMDLSWMSSQTRNRLMSTRGRKSPLFLPPLLLHLVPRFHPRLRSTTKYRRGFTKKSMELHAVGAHPLSGQRFPWSEHGGCSPRQIHGLRGA